MEARSLFPQQPKLHFFPPTPTCQCGVKLTVLKTWAKTVATLTIGQFKAVETQKVCHQCKAIYRSEELRKLTPHRGQFGFDIIEYIGKALFVDCRNELSIQADLAVKNIPLLTQFKSNYGNPIALVHDMGNVILKAVKTVFPTVPDYICHCHFLRDIGKDLFEGEEVLEEEQKNKALFGKYPRNIRRLFKLNNLPELLMEAA
jgi:hypothetical protein